MVPIQIKTCLENNIVLNWTMLKRLYVIEMDLVSLEKRKIRYSYEEREGYVERGNKADKELKRGWRVHLQQWLLQNIYVYVYQRIDIAL